MRSSAKNAPAAESLHLLALLSFQSVVGAVLPPPLSTKNRDALDDLYVPLAAQSALEELIGSCLAES